MSEQLSIVEFINARLDEDELAAFAASSDDPADAWGEYGEFASRAGMPDIDLALRFSPERVLADIAAKRRILALNAPPDESHELGECANCDTTRLLAAPFLSHPDYRAEWSVSE